MIVISLLCLMVNTLHFIFLKVTERNNIKEHNEFKTRMDQWEAEWINAIGQEAWDRTAIKR